MAAHIPVAAATLVGFLNLPSDMTSLGLWTHHQPLVLAEMQGYLTTAAYADAILATPTNPSTSFVSMYCFLMLASTAEFLNLKTLGQGIVKTVGLDASATELLTGDEIEEFKDRLVARALKAATAYLSQAGIDKLRELSPALPKGSLRVAII